jgi:hypothetical protein
MRSETFPRRLTAEFIGTAMLLTAVVGSGIMGDRLAGGNAAIALLANTLATGAALVTLILTLGRCLARTSILRFRSRTQLKAAYRLPRRSRTAWSNVPAAWSASRLRM